MARMELDEVARIGDQPVARVGSRFLPVPAALFPPLCNGDAGMVDLSVPAGTPVYAMEAGRVTHADGASVGEVVVRGENGTRFHYRRMVPSSVAVSEGVAIEAGTVLGIVAASRSSSSLNFGIQHSDGTWQRAADALVGLSDPSELFLLPPRPGDAGLVSELPSQRRPARATAASPRPATATRPAPAPQPTVAPTPAPTPAPPPTPAQPAVATPEPVPDPAPAPAQPAANLSAADRLTRPRARPGAAATPEPSPPAATTDLPAPPPPEPAVADPVAAPEPPVDDRPEPPPTSDTTVVMEPAPTPEPEPADEPSTPAADDARVNALVGRRRRPRGNN